MLGGLCSFTKEGWLGSKASEAKAAKKVLQTQLSLWPEGIPARHQSLYSWPKFCYDLKKKKKKTNCGGVRFRQRNKLGVEWNPKRKRLFFSEAAVRWWRQQYYNLEAATNKISVQGNPLKSKYDVNIHAFASGFTHFLSFSCSLRLTNCCKKTEACDSGQETKCKRSLRRSVCLLWGSCMLVKQHI